MGHNSKSLGIHTSKSGVSNVGSFDDLCPGESCPRQIGDQLQVGLVLSSGQRDTEFGRQAAILKPDDPWSSSLCLSRLGSMREFKLNKCQNLNKKLLILGYILAL